MLKKLSIIKRIIVAFGLLCLLGMLNMGVTHIFDQSKIQKKIVLEKAIKRAAIECYALEGMYPPDITYLEAHYGIQIDHQHYAVYYDAFADNIMPEIQVHLIKKGV